MSGSKRSRTATARGRKARQAPTVTPAPAPRSISGLQVLLIPLALTGLLLLLSLTPRAQASPILTGSFWAAAALLLVFQGVLYSRLKSAGATRSLSLLPPRPQHYIQATVQLSVFAYWGWYWEPVYGMAALIAAQLVFAYAFDMLLGWSRRESYVLGFGPFPIIFSINLFLWFRDDWFYLQFLMIAIGFLGKELIRWQREGRAVHIFNPSAFSLGLFSLILIVTGTTNLTWGQEIASTLRLAPHIYLFLFSIGLVVMYFFSITLVAASAAIVLFGWSALYAAVTGVPYFLDTEIPTAVFLGLHLLVTDPSTSPRTPPGKIFFGVMYGVSVFALYGLLGALGAPTFYDKLLAVPLLNLSVRKIDHLLQSLRASPAWERWRIEWAASRPNLAHMGIWILFFGAMTAMGRTDGPHIGDQLPFWAQACEEGRPTACRRLVQIQATYCADNSGWACNEVGAHYTRGRLVDENPDLALGYFARACELRFQPGCFNLLEPGSAEDAIPRPFDLRLLLREGRQNLMDAPEPELYARACAHGWEFACGRIGAPSRTAALGARDPS